MKAPPPPPPTAFVVGMMGVGVNHDLQGGNITMINPGTHISAASLSCIFYLVEFMVWGQILFQKKNTYTIQLLKKFDRVYGTGPNINLTNAHKMHQF